jgi:hypothetical protein
VATLGGGGLSDISLSWGPIDWLVIALVIGAPGIGVGAACGALIWRARRLKGAALGAGLGWAACLAAFLAWADGKVSARLGFWEAVLAGLAHAAPGLVIGAGLRAWLPPL